MLLVCRKQQVRDPIRYGMLLIKETLRYDIPRRCDFTFPHLAVKKIMRRVPYRTGPVPIFLNKEQWSYEVEEEHPPPTNNNDRRPRAQETPHRRRRAAQHPVHEQAGTSSGATWMDVNLDTTGQDTPLGTPFDEGSI